MKILHIDAPNVLSYYLSNKYKELIQEKCKYGHCEILEGNENQLYMVVDYDSDLFAVFKLYLDKTEIITLGSQYKYEYEMGFSGTEDDIIFGITLEDNKEYICKLKYSNIETSCTILLIFDIIDIKK